MSNGSSVQRKKLLSKLSNSNLLNRAGSVPNLSSRKDSSSEDIKESEEEGKDDDFLNRILQGAPDEEAKQIIQK
jgi:hypothetical protein